MQASDALFFSAETAPLPGVSRPGPHQTYRNGRLRLSSRTLPALGPHDLRLEMQVVGICGTDLHVTENHPQTGYIRSSAPLAVPERGRILGHEGVGKVVAVGELVTDFVPGRLVALESIISCQRCDVCRKGRFNQCRNARLLGMETDGLFQHYADVPSHLAHDVTNLVRDDADLEALACVEPAAVAFVACENAGVKPGDSVLIFGAGPLGVYSAILCRSAFGAARVIVVEPVSFRRELARQWADEVWSPEEFGRQAPRLNAVLEASGALENVDAVIDCVDAQGTIVLLARSGADLVLTKIDQMISREITVKGSRGHLGGAFTRVLELYRTQKLPLRGPVTQVLTGLEQLKHCLTEGRVVQEHCKVVVDLRQSL